MDEGEAVAERVSDDTEEMATVLTSMDAVIVLASGVVDVPTGSEEVPTACPVFAIATVVTPYRRRKGKEVMVKFETPKKQKVQEQIDAQIARELEEQHAREDQKRDEQIARDAEIARIHADEELHSMIDGLDSNNETVARYLEEYRQFSSELHMERRIELINDLVKYQDNYTNVYKFQSQQRKSWTKKQKRDYYMAMITNNLGWKVKDFKGMPFEEVEAKFNLVCKQMEDFIPMGSKEEAERIKRKGNMSYLSDFNELNGRYVAFGGNLKGGKISGKDENQVLLRVPKENNMYNVDLKNIVPSRDLTCLFAK
nr:hypothetical protein [Tanacetum cinerariifolium]